MRTTAAMSQADVVQMIRLRVRSHGKNITAAANELGVSPPYLWQIINGIREPGPKVLKALGLRAEVRYVADTGQEKINEA